MKKLVIHISGMYLNDIIEILRNKLNSLRNEPQFSSLSEQDWILFQIDYIGTWLGHDNLNCAERGEYLKKVISQCIGINEIQKYFSMYKITCFDENKQMKMFFALCPIDGSNKKYYMLSDNSGMEFVEQDKIKAMFDNGMRILSQKNRKEYREVLRGEHYVTDSTTVFSDSIRRMALLPAVMKETEEAMNLLKAIEEQSRKKGSYYGE